MEYTDRLDQTEYTRLVRILRGSASAAVDSWELIPISGGQSGAPVYRAKGTGTDLEGPFNWSLILKNCTNIGQWGDVYAADDPCWQREMLIYQSDLLVGIPGGLRPPRLVEASRQSPTEIVLWLEDVGNIWSERWSMERYSLAAFHLGQFNAHYADRPPQETWLGRGQWSRYVGNECRGGIEGLEKNRDHPEVLAVYPRTIQQRLFALRDDSADFIARANTYSILTLYHGDASGRNLYDYQGDTVAIDWFSVGIAPLGEEIARMVGSSIHWFFIGRIEEAPVLVESVLTSYIEGLRDAGWRGDPTAVIYTFKAVLGTIYGLSYVGIANGIAEDRLEQRATNAYKTTVPEMLEHMGGMARFFLGQADEARALALGLS